MDVAVRELKAKLSSYLKQAAAGETIELDAATCELAATLAEQSGVRSLDALDLGAARRRGVGLSFLTFDVRQAQAARAVGLTVVGV